MKMRMGFIATVSAVALLSGMPAASFAADKMSKEERAAQKAAEKAVKDQVRAEAKAAKDAEKAAKLAAAARLKGPYEPDVAQFTSIASPDLTGKYRALFVEGERNAVLNFNRIGVLEFQAGNLERAKWAFDNSILRISQIYANDPGAKQAKSLWSAESVKDFKGEPYERAMAYYYRGLVDLVEGDFQNARAAFKEGEYQDTVSEAEEYASDFAVLPFLSGWASQCDGDNGLAEEFYGFAATANADLARPEPDHNLLVLADGGIGPTKFGDGQYREVLKVADGTDAGVTGVFTLAMDGSEPLTLEAKRATDITFQATTRGGRPVQGILNGKAQFKETSGVIGEAATTAGLAMLANAGDDSDMAAAGGIIAIAGLFAGAMSAAATPAADVRYWDNLPNAVFAATAKVSGPVKVAFGGSDMLIGGNDRCRVAWTRTGPAVPDNAPNAAPTGRPSKQTLAKDVQFRNQLLAEVQGSASAGGQQR
jgi:hypothetical protein